LGLYAARREVCIGFSSLEVNSPHRTTLIFHTYRASWTLPIAIRDLRQGRGQAEDVISRGARITTQQFATIFTEPTELVVLVFLLVLGAFGLAMRAAPFALWRLLEIRVQTYQMVGPRTCVTEDNLAALLTGFTIVLVFLLLKKI